MEQFKEARDSIKVPAELQDAYDRLVLAGMKMLFDKQSSINIDEAFDRDNGKDIGKKMSDGIVALMQILFKQSKGMPAEVIIPAATNLLTQVVEYAVRAGYEVPPAVMSKATQDVIYGILQQMGGLSPAKVNAMFNQFAQKGGV